MASQHTFASARTDVACVLQNMEQHNLRDEQKIRKPAFPVHKVGHDNETVTQLNMQLSMRHSDDCAP